MSSLHYEISKKPSPSMNTPAPYVCKYTSLTYFLFNNVKSDHKTMFCLQNQKEYEIKMLSLPCLYPYRKP